MAPNDQTPPSGKRGRGRPPVRTDEVVGQSPSGSKIMSAFRIPKPLHGELTREAQGEGSDLTGYVNRLFDGFLHHFSLPSVIRDGLENDRLELGFGRYEYLQYILFRRYEAVTKSGPAFDRPTGPQGK
jgi:hypothetical protein